MACSMPKNSSNQEVAGRSRGSEHKRAEAEMIKLLRLNCREAAERNRFDVDGKLENPERTQSRSSTYRNAENSKTHKLTRPRVG
jgi:hypothetical protein